MNSAHLLNAAWMWSCRREVRRFRAATANVASSQAEVLARMLHDNRDTEFGRRYKFDCIRDPLEYQGRVPLTTYEAIAPAIQKIAAGESNTLTKERVRFLQPTSGTTGGEKLIPYTAALRQQYQRAVAAWIGNLYRELPAVRSGRAYWSISPGASAPRCTPGGISIGFDDDTAYLGQWAQKIARRVLAVPGEVTKLQSISLFRYITLLKLLSADDLALISIWNPTFLLALLAELGNWSDRLCWDLEHGRISPPFESDECLESGLINSLRPNFKRAGQLRALLGERDGSEANIAAIWPKLALISCWTEAAAERHAQELRGLFPNVEIQSKGLLATEGCVSFPLVGRSGSALALRSHFLEFQPVSGIDFLPNAAERCRLAHELELHNRYGVVLTTGGGLYRYQLGDTIEVVGFDRQCPLVRFVGKSDQTSDLVGEKLAEPHVRDVLEQLFAKYQLRPNFALLTPCDEPPRHYRLFLQFEATTPANFNLQNFRDNLEGKLEENPHYRYAVQLKQLSPVAVTVLDPRGEPAYRVFERSCVARGQRLGDIKPGVLDRWTGWASYWDV